MRLTELQLPRTEAGGVWRMPASRSKNGQGLKVPLSPLAREIIEDAIAQSGTHLVFPSSIGKPFVAWSKAKGELIRCMSHFLAPAWRHHDFRRSFATCASEELGVPIEVADRCLNHVGSSTTSSVTRVYAQGELFDQRKAALEGWADWLAEGLHQRRTAEKEGSKRPVLGPSR